MVLKIINILICGMSIFLVSHNGPLLNQYQKKLQKDLKKIYNLKNSEIAFSNLESPDVSIERYQLSVDQNSLGFLFIKEVKACNLNGCSADKLLNNNLGSEYYDIAVFTDRDMHIQKVKVLDYFSDYGYEIASKRYLKKFQEKNVCEFSKDAPQVDGISGATISYNALIASMEDFCQIQCD